MQFTDTIEPNAKTNADYQRRLIDFETGKFELKPGHKQWLNWLLEKTPATQEFYCDIYGYASKLGDEGKNLTLGFNRANEVAKYLESLNPKFTPRFRKFQTYGENEPGYKADDWHNTPDRRAVEVHFRRDHPPFIKPGVLPIPGKPTNMKWSISGYFSLAKSISMVAQFGVCLFKIRNDETKQIRNYIAPVMGFGGGLDVTKLGSLKPSQLMEWLKSLVGKSSPGSGMLDKAVEKILQNPLLLSNPKAIMKQIGMDVATGASASDWTDFTQCEANYPLDFNKLDGKTVGNVSVTTGNYQFQRIYVYGNITYKELSGKNMTATKDLLYAESGSWVAQVPAFSGGAVGGPLILL